MVSNHRLNPALNLNSSNPNNNSLDTLLKEDQCILLILAVILQLLEGM